VKFETKAFGAQQVSLHSSFPCTASHSQPKQTGPQALTLAVDNLTLQQQQEDEDVELQDEAPGVDRGAGRGNRGHGFVELGARRAYPQQQDDGLGKPKFSIPKFEGDPDVEEYLT
jgi:hypothetical protein